jgi:hypothetical protein
MPFHKSKNKYVDKDFPGAYQTDAPVVVAGLTPGQLVCKGCIRPFTSQHLIHSDCTALSFSLITQLCQKPFLGDV